MPCSLAADMINGLQRERLFLTDVLATCLGLLQVISGMTNMR